VTGGRAFASAILDGCGCGVGGAGRVAATTVGCALRGAEARDVVARGLVVRVAAARGLVARVVDERFVAARELDERAVDLRAVEAFDRGCRGFLGFPASLGCFPSGIVRTGSR
jgi:hypothetical protein